MKEVEERLNNLEGAHYSVDGVVTDMVTRVERLQDQHTHNAAQVDLAF